MAPPIAKRPVNLVSRLGKTVTAHQAVHEGIATHAEKERVRRLETLRKMEADARLMEGITASRDTL